MEGAAGPQGGAERQVGHSTVQDVQVPRVPFGHARVPGGLQREEGWMSSTDPTGGERGDASPDQWRWVALELDHRVGRGGQWFLMRRCSDPGSRYRMPPSNRHTEFGFRPVCSAGRQ